MPPIKNISEVTEPLKEQILQGNIHTIDEMRAWLRPLGYSDTINEAAIIFILCEFVMSKVSASSLMSMDMVVDLLRPQLEVTKEDIEPFRYAKWLEPNSFELWHGEKRSNEIQPVIIMGLYNHRNLIGSPSAFMKTCL